MTQKIDRCKTTEHNFQRFLRIWRNAHKVTLSEEVDDTEPFFNIALSQLCAI